MSNPTPSILCPACRRINVSHALFCGECGLPVNCGAGRIDPRSFVRRGDVLGIALEASSGTNPVWISLGAR